MKTTFMTVLLAATLPNAGFAQDAAAMFMAEWDLNSNGEVTTLEARTTLTSIFSEFDTNLDGYLDDSDEAGEDAGEAPDSAVSMAFDDDDGDGRVSMLEFINQDADWIALMDQDSDGVITASDFNSL